MVIMPAHVYCTPRHPAIHAVDPSPSAPPAAPGTFIACVRACVRACTCVRACACVDACVAAGWHRSSRAMNCLGNRVRQRRCLESSQYMYCTTLLTAEPCVRVCVCVRARARVLDMCHRQAAGLVLDAPAAVMPRIDRLQSHPPAHTLTSINIYRYV